MSMTTKTPRRYIVTFIDKDGARVKFTRMSIRGIEAELALVKAEYDNARSFWITLHPESQS